MIDSKFRLLRFIPIRVHVIADFASGLILLLAPWLFNWPVGQASSIFSTSAGAAILIISILTCYPAGLLKIIPFQVHLTMDLILGIIFLFAGNALPGHPHPLFIVMTVVALLFGLWTRKSMIR